MILKTQFLSQKHMLISNIVSNFRELGRVKNTQYILLGINYFIKKKATNSDSFFYVYTYIRVIISYNLFFEKK